MSTGPRKGGRTHDGGAMLRVPRRADGGGRAHRRRMPRRRRLHTIRLQSLRAARARRLPKVRTLQARRRGASGRGMIPLPSHCAPAPGSIVTHLDNHAEPRADPAPVDARAPHRPTIGTAGVEAPSGIARTPRPEHDGQRQPRERGSDAARRRYRQHQHDRSRRKRDGRPRRMLRRTRIVRQRGAEGAAGQRGGAGSRVGPTW